MWTLTLWLAIFAATLLILQPKLHEKRKLLSFLCHLALALPFISLASRFLVNDTSILHVAAYGGAALPLKYRFAATWAAREGPILLWVLWMSLLSWIWRKPLSGENAEDTKGITAHQLRLRLVHGFSLLLLSRLTVEIQIVAVEIVEVGAERRNRTLTAREVIAESGMPRQFAGAEIS